MGENGIVGDDCVRSVDGDVPRGRSLVVARMRASAASGGALRADAAVRRLSCEPAARDSPRVRATSLSPESP